jgi:PAS domain S-box-containing protein
MRLSTNQKIAAGFAAALLILLVGALSLLSARRALDDARWVAHTHEVLARLDALVAAVVNVETGQRGFVITGEPRFLEPYEVGVQQLPQHLAAVRRLTADNPRQQARLDSLGPVIEARLAFTREVIRRRRQEGMGPAVALVATDRGKRLMDEMRRRIGTMQVEERSLLAGRLRARAEGERRAEVVTLVGSAVAFALVVLMIRVIQQDVALQGRTARERDALLVREQAARAQLAAIQRVTDAALGPLALDDLLTELLRRLREVLAVDTACVLLVMRDGEHLELCKCVGPTEEIAGRVKVPVGRGVEGRIAATREAIAVEAMDGADVFDPIVREHFASLLGAPLVVPARAVAGGAVAPAGASGAHDPERSDGERVIGVVHVESLTPRRFSASERELLMLVAERAASAIERARLHQAERRTEERFRLLVEGVQDYAIFMLDPEGRVVSWNAGAERLNGYAAGEIVGESFARFYTPEDRERGAPERALATAATDGRCHSAGWRVRADGSRFWADELLTALRDEDDGHLLGFAKVTHDLTERKRADEALLEAKEAAEAANRAKSQFLATMSHEIRTPINAVLGYTDLLDAGVDGPLTERQHARLVRLRASGRHLLGLVNELLDLAKIEAEQLHVERVRGSAGDAVAGSLALLHPQANARSLSVTNRCAADVDAAYLGDPHRVQQVLANLLSNAVKFTPVGGRIDVECGLTELPDEAARLADAGDGGATCWCYVRVADSGPGIAAEQQEAVFEPFVQATSSSSAYTREHGGTGLGLAISRRLARLMGGDVTLQSEVGAGATFTLWLPAPPEVRRTATGEPAGCTTDERRSERRHVAGLLRAGTALRDQATALVVQHVQRLRAEPDVPGAATSPDSELEDHLGTLVTEVARALVLMGEAGGEPSRALRDGTEIQRVLAERHGAQRAALGWPERAHRRELALLRERVESLLRDALAGHPEEADADAVVAIAARLLAFVERVGERARRSAAGA